MLKKGLNTDRLGATVSLFGVPFDPLPSKEALMIKTAYMQAEALGATIQPNYQSPYDFLSTILPDVISSKCRLLGEVTIPSWLWPKPQITDACKLTLESLSEFIKSGGCLAIANKVYDFVINSVLPGVPGMIGVDHSSTYGTILALVEDRHEDLGLVVLDAHSDIVPADLRYGLMEYTKGKKLSDMPPDLLSQSLSASSSSGEAREWSELNAENFLLHILENKLIEPKNIVLVGITDYPVKAFEDSDDTRLRDYFNFFKSLERKGVRFVPKSTLNKYGTEPLKKALQGMNARNIYISLDIDVGSLSCVYACRFLDSFGLSLDEILNVFKLLFIFFSNGFNLAGFDLMEVDIHKLGARINSSHVDQTSKISRLFLNMVGDIT